MDDDQLDPAVLDRFLAGECSPAERQRVLAWFETTRPRGVDPGVMWDRVEAALDRDNRARPRVLVLPIRRSASLWRSVRVAATIVAAAAGSFAAWRMGWLATAQPFREFASAPGSRTTITLRDGTRLVLGPATHLRVPRSFGGATRMVELDGEALLTVAHNARHPFAVRTAQATIRDVGTTFVVHAYEDDPTERVTVTEGSVAVAGVALRAGDDAVIDGHAHLTVQHGVDPSRALAWTRGGLAFQDAPLRDVARELERTYDVDVTIADPTLAAKPITASFSDEPLDAVLNVIMLAAGGHYERTGRTIVIRRGIIPASRPLHFTRT